MAKRPSRSQADEQSAAAPTRDVKKARGATRGQSGGVQPPRTAAKGAEDPGAAAPRPPEALGDLAPNDVMPGDAAEDMRADDPSEEDIRHRAYLRYLERGGGHGSDFDDWLHAERELKKK